MKTHFFFLVFINLFTGVLAQDKTNYVSSVSYSNIRYNGKTIMEIRALGQHNKSAIDSFAGSVSVRVDHPYFEGTDYHFGPNRIAFNTSDVIGVHIENTAWSVTLNGVELKVGDSLTKVAAALGTAQVIMTSSASNDPNFWIFISTNGIDEALVVKIHPTNKVIVQLKYHVSI